MKRLDGVLEGEWSTVSLTATTKGLVAREKSDRFNVEAMTELVLRLVGGLMVAGSTMLWLVLPLGAETTTMISHSALAALCTATGLIVYAYGTRGFRRQMVFDAKTQSVSLTKININEQGRVSRRFKLDEIESLFLRRPATRGALASLYVRVHDVDTPVLALTGATEELERVHNRLCAVIQAQPNRLVNPVDELAEAPSVAAKPPRLFAARA